MKNMIFSLIGNISMQALTLVIERFRCRHLVSGQDRCQVFVGGRFRFFLKKPRLCGQVGCWGYKVAE